MNDDQATVVIDERLTGAAGQPATVEAQAEAVAEEVPATSRMPGAKVQAAAGAAVAVAAAGLLLASIGRSGGKLALAPGERVLISTRPRKVGWRYLATLGLWEMARRSTRFTVTDQRIVIEEGILSRTTRSVPLSRIGNVNVTTRLWQGFVDLSGTGRGGGTRESLGPFRNPVARNLAMLVSHSMGGHAPNDDLD
jgi:hypothetical protein